MRSLGRLCMIALLAASACLNGCAIAETMVMTTHYRHSGAPRDYDASGVDPAIAQSDARKPAPRIPLRVVETPNKN